MGRTALLARLDHLLIEEPGDRWVVVTGGSGMGKSALLAAWLARREAASESVPHHFIRRGEYDWDDPAKLVGSLVAQIVARFPNQPEPESDSRMHPAARLYATLQRVSQHELVPHDQRLVVLIDGLDEYDPPADSRASPLGRDPLAEFLPSALPHGVSVQIDGLSAVLAEDAVLYSDGGGKRKAALNPIYGRDRVLRFLTGIQKKSHMTGEAARPARINGLPGFVLRTEGRLETLALELRDDAIAAIYLVRNPDKLRHVALS